MNVHFTSLSCCPRKKKKRATITRECEGENQIRAMKKQYNLSKFSQRIMKHEMKCAAFSKDCHNIVERCSLLQYETEGMQMD